jgi:hypothetical protein
VFVRMENGDTERSGGVSLARVADNNNAFTLSTVSLGWSTGWDWRPSGTKSVGVSTLRVGNNCRRGPLVAPMPVVMPGTAPEPTDGWMGVKKRLFSEGGASALSTDALIVLSTASFCFCSTAFKLDATLVRVSCVLQHHNKHRSLNAVAGLPSTKIRKPQN